MYNFPHTATSRLAVAKHIHSHILRARTRYRRAPMFTIVACSNEHSEHAARVSSLNKVCHEVVSLRLGPAAYRWLDRGRHQKRAGRSDDLIASRDARAKSYAQEQSWFVMQTTCGRGARLFPSSWPGFGDKNRLETRSPNVSLPIYLAAPLLQGSNPSSDMHHSISPPEEVIIIDRFT